MAGMLRSWLPPYGPRVLRSAGQPGPSSGERLSFRSCGRRRNHDAQTETAGALIMVGLSCSFVWDLCLGTAERECMTSICDHGRWIATAQGFGLAPQVRGDEFTAQEDLFLTIAKCSRRHAPA